MCCCFPSWVRVLRSHEYHPAVPSDEGHRHEEEVWGGNLVVLLRVGLLVWWGLNPLYPTPLKADGDSLGYLLCLNPQPHARQHAESGSQVSIIKRSSSSSVKECDPACCYAALVGPMDYFQSWQASLEMQSLQPFFHFKLRTMTRLPDQLSKDFCCTLQILSRCLRKSMHQDRKWINLLSYSLQIA